MKNLRQKKRKVKSHSEFWDTVKDIRKMTDGHLKQGVSRFIEAPGKKKQKGTKTPLPILAGMRKAVKSSLKEEQESNRENNIQYRSDAKLKNLQTLNKQKRKSAYQKNSYKFNDLKSKAVGKMQGGTLTFTNREVHQQKKQR